MILQKKSRTKRRRIESPSHTRPPYLFTLSHTETKSPSSLSHETKLETEILEREKIVMSFSRVHNFFFLCIFVILSVSYASEEEEKEFVLTLDHSNFSEIVTKNNFIVVEFYAPWYIFLSLFIDLTLVFVCINLIRLI